MEDFLVEKTAIISGGASGIGKAAALKLAEVGFRVCLLDVNDTKLKEVKKEMEEKNFKVITIPCDMSQYDQVETAVKKVIKQWGRIDAVFANAGIVGQVSSIESMSIDNWNQVLSINLNGTFFLVKAAIPHVKQQGGSIIITSSISGNRVFSQAGFTAYSTSKAALAAFAKMAALELAKYHIRVNVICPGGIETNFKESIKRSPDLDEIKIPVAFPEGSKPLDNRSGKPEEVADLVKFLASDESSHITGTEIYIDGAESLLIG
ncbi:SDR family oxidoreductase [Terribacillus saccharophilus]|uniref:SDR family oxidoreductase n=1 Tax=Terribacillus saccharophilus TaxID=361277 RepID=UPI002989F661|nr:SDR family NAD(P)-dependent oxidoreductase [Terribacillus saccharophilus]MCM3224246.1 SDR family oxidoreductase [Terribacillus saccharophilus]MEC0283846.1 SDR family NAD(P)-dependent oxidoreductase [Terribacillus saccharophilus]MEC0290802.1 SDR family NAD(P)-dependent oxidoreductase [Terribacillus saccharophilus]